MKKQLMIILIVFTLLALLSACAATNSTLVDTSWQLTSLAGKEPLKDVEVTLNFSKDTIGGNDGCNTYGGSYQSSKDTITFGNDIFSTMMYCTDEIAAQYNFFYDALKQAASYKITDGNLSLLDVSGELLVGFTKIQN